MNRVPLDLLERARRRHPDPARRLHAFVRADAAALCRFPFDINEIHRLAGANDATFAPYWEERRLLETQVAEIVAHGVADGAFVDVLGLGDVYLGAPVATRSTRGTAW